VIAWNSVPIPWISSVPSENFNRNPFDVVKPFSVFIRVEIRNGGLHEFKPERFTNFLEEAVIFGGVGLPSQHFKAEPATFWVRLDFLFEMA
jgi:hypothetical protein